MAVTVDTRPVDPRVIQAWKQAITTVSDGDLQAYMAPHPRLIAGFRKGKINTAVALTRVQALLDRSGELPADLRAMLRGCTLSTPLLSVLSDEAIAAAMPALADALGRMRTYAALLLDDREAVRGRGFDQIAGWAGLEPTPVEQAEVSRDRGRETEAEDQLYTHQERSGRRLLPLTHPCVLSTSGTSSALRSGAKSRA